MSSGEVLRQADQTYIQLAKIHNKSCFFLGLGEKEGRKNYSGGGFAGGL